MLVAGSSGFLGGQLVDALCRAGCDVVGVSRHGSASAAVAAQGRFKHVVVDLRDRAATQRMIRDVRPTHLLHAAGVLPGSGVDWMALHDGNVLTTVNLLEAVGAEGLEPWILLTSSSAVYGAGLGRNIDEETPFQPISLYGVAKATQELVGAQAKVAAGLRVVTVRIFNLIGPGQPSSLVVSDIARQIATAERQGSSIVQVGNLESERDYVDVRDAAAAMVSLAEVQAVAGPYNIASGTPHSVRECVDSLLRLSSKALTVQTVQDRQRKVDIPRQVGDSTRLRRVARWRPLIDFDDSLRDVLDHWRVRLDDDGGR